MTEKNTEHPRHIVYLDDDETLVFLIGRLLQRRGHRVTALTDQHQAIELVRHQPQGVDLLLTDYNMPGMSGLDVAQAVLAINPALVVALASGYLDDELHARALDMGVCEVVLKTTGAEAFCDVVERLLQGDLPRAWAP